MADPKKLKQEALKLIAACSISTMDELTFGETNFDDSGGVVQGYRGKNRDDFIDVSSAGAPKGRWVADPDGIYSVEGTTSRQEFTRNLARAGSVEAEILVSEGAPGPGPGWRNVKTGEWSTETPISTQ